VHGEKGEPVRTPSPLPEKKAANPNIGWESEPVTAHLRQIQARRQAEAERIARDQAFAEWQTAVESKLSATAHLRENIHIFGHTLDAILRAKRCGEGRVWLLVRYLDQANGEGRVPVAHLRQKLVDEWQVLSWKRLRQLLNRGTGLFWHRDTIGEFLYYHSEARVAQSLGVTQLNGLALAVPVRDLLLGIKHVRALFYDAFHSARHEGYGNPITRQVMETRGNGDGRTQREYEGLRGIRNKANYVNVGKYEKKLWQWEKGRETVIGLPLGPAFRHVDYNGRLGHNPARAQRKKGQQHWHNIYIMRRMANSYSGTLKTVKRGRKWTNLKLENLCCSMHTPAGSFEGYEVIQLYHNTEKKAYRFQQRKRDDVDAYYPQSIAQEVGERPRSPRDKPMMTDYPPCRQRD
jgi:hypothetical protein